MHIWCPNPREPAVYLHHRLPLEQPERPRRRLVVNVRHARDLEEMVSAPERAGLVAAALHRLVAHARRGPRRRAGRAPPYVSRSYSVPMPRETAHAAPLTSDLLLVLAR